MQPRLKSDKNQLKLVNGLIQVRNAILADYVQHEPCSLRAFIHRLNVSDYVYEACAKGLRKTTTVPKCKAHFKPQVSALNNDATLIVKQALENGNVNYTRLIREKRITGIQGHCIKFYCLRGGDLNKILLDKQLAVIGLVSKIDRKYNDALISLTVHWL
jgi:hypothetical protein